MSASPRFSRFTREELHFLASGLEMGRIARSTARYDVLAKVNPEKARELSALLALLVEVQAEERSR